MVSKNLVRTIHFNRYPMNLEDMLTSWKEEDTVTRLAWLGGGLLAAYLVNQQLRHRMTSLAGQTVLITGGSRGLGLALAEEFARTGCRIVICARDEDELQRARRHLEAQ